MDLTGNVFVTNNQTFHKGLDIKERFLFQTFPFSIYNCFHPSFFMPFWKLSKLKNLAMIKDERRRSSFFAIKGEQTQDLVCIWRLGESHCLPFRPFIAQINIFLVRVKKNFFTLVLFHPLENWKRVEKGLGEIISFPFSNYQGCHHIFFKTARRTTKMKKERQKLNLWKIMIGKKFRNNY